MRIEWSRARSGATIRLALAAALVGAAAVGAAARVPLDAAGSPSERDKVGAAINLIASALRPMYGTTLNSLLGPAGPAGAGYDPVNGPGGPHEPTIEDLVNTLAGLHGSKNIEKGALPGGKGRCRREDGHTADRIWISTAILGLMCDMKAPPEDRFRAKMELIGVLANEATHAMQTAAVPNDQQACDQEKDSDMVSAKLMTMIKDALTTPEGTPHTTIAGIAGDAQAVPELSKCMLAYGIPNDDAEAIAIVANGVSDALGTAAIAGQYPGYAGRVAHFAADLGAGVSWRNWYTTGADGNPRDNCNEDTSGRSSTRSYGSGASSVELPVPPGHLIIVGPGFENSLDQAMVGMASAGPGAERRLTFFRDGNGDGLGDMPPIWSQPLGPPLVPGARGLYDMGIYAGLPPVLHSGGTGHGVFITDVLDGALFKLEMAPDGSPSGPPQLVFQGLPLLDGPDISLDLGVSAVRLILSNGRQGEAQAVWYEITSALAVTPFTNPGQTLAQAESPYRMPGVTDAFHGNPGPIQLIGNAGQPVQVASIGRGSFQPMANGVCQNNGRTLPLALGQPIAPNDLLQTTNSFGWSEVFVPRLGSWIGAATSEETGLSPADLVCLSVNPTRLHLLENIGSFARTKDFPPGPFSHRFEMALELGEYVGFGTWDGFTRSLRRDDETDDAHFTPVYLPSGVLYAQRLFDLNSNSVSDEAVVILRDGMPPAFRAVFLSAVGSGGVIDQSLALPGGFEPRGYQVADLNGDGRLDVRIEDFLGGPDMCLLNSAGPPALRFSLGSCAAPPCCFGNADKATGSVNFADVTSVLVNFGATYGPPASTGPGDADCNTTVTFADVTSVLVNFGAPCP